jgi:hypothetical protein
VTSPTGDYWEIYVSKTALPGWRGGDGDLSYFETGTAQGDLLQLPVVIVSILWTTVLMPLARAMVLLPVSMMRGRRSRAVRIEAVRNFPSRQVLLWTTTDAHLPRVLDEIVAGLARDAIAEPSGAVYSGLEP